MTALPASPADAQEIAFLVDAANGIVWRFRYRAASTSPYRWEFTGGAPLYVDANTPVNLTALAAFTDCL